MNTLFLNLAIALGLAFTQPGAVRGHFRDWFP